MSLSPNAIAVSDALYSRLKAECAGLPIDSVIRDPSFILIQMNRQHRDGCTTALSIHRCGCQNPSAVAVNVYDREVGVIVLEPDPAARRAKMVKSEWRRFPHSDPDLMEKVVSRVLELIGRWGSKH